MLTVTTDSGRELSGFDIAAAAIAAVECRKLVDQLKRKGGGFTAHAEAVLRAKAERFDREAAWIEALFAEQEGGA